MKPGDAMVRVGSNGRTAQVKIKTVGRKWVTTDYEPGDRYHVATLEHEQLWARLYTPEDYATERAETAERLRLRGTLHVLLGDSLRMPIERVRRLIAALEE